MVSTGEIAFWIEYAALGLEMLAVAIILIGIGVATIRYFVKQFRQPTSHQFREYRSSIGSALLLGLEILIAADIVKTVALEPTWENVGILGMLVLIRTFLSWSLFVDIEERWPWQPKPEAQE
jgi:uncharacterized membrane protein